MKKIFYILFFVAAVPAFSQSSITSLQYPIGFGSGDLGSFISVPSFRGFTIDYRRMLQPNIGLGIDVGWNVFYSEKSFDTYDNGNLTFSGKQWRYSNHIPILLAVDYYLKPGEQLNAFAGLGIGTMYSLRNTDMGQFTLEEEAWHFALRPEVGLIIKATEDVSFSVTGKYYYGLESGDLASQGYFTMNFGIVFTKD
jgi:hypothetical protein